MGNLAPAWCAKPAGCRARRSCSCRPNGRPSPCPALQRCCSPRWCGPLRGFAFFPACGFCFWDFSIVMGNNFRAVERTANSEQRTAKCSHPADTVESALPRRWCCPSTQATCEARRAGYQSPHSIRIATSQSSKISSLAIFTRTPTTPGSCIKRRVSLPIRLSSRSTCSAVHSSMMIWRTLR